MPSLKPELTAASLARITTVVRGECLRQHVGEDRMFLLLQAYQEAWTLWDGGEAPTQESVLRLAGMLEPTSGGELRSTPVTFTHGGGSTAPQNLPHTLERLFSILGEEVLPLAEEVADSYVRAFEVAHPLTDGNGRTAFLLRVWLLGQFAHPEPLPHYLHY